VFFDLGRFQEELDVFAECTRAAGPQKTACLGRQTVRNDRVRKSDNGFSRHPQFLACQAEIDGILGPFAVDDKPGMGNCNIIKYLGNAEKPPRSFARSTTALPVIPV